MLKNQSITVIGAGIGGLAGALGLASRGARVRVLEQAGALTEVGAGLQVTPNGVAVLDGLGLGDRLRAIAVRSEAVVLRDYRHGVQVMRLDVSGGARPYLLVHRADLIDVLAAGAQAAGVEIELEQAVSSVVEDSDGVRLGFEDGGSETVELLVGADGLQSRLRPVLNGEADPFFTGQVAWRAVVSGAVGSGVDLYMGPGRHVVTYPLRSRSLTNIVAVEERRDWTAEGWQHPGNAEDLKRAFSMFCPQVLKLLDRVEDVNIWGLFRHPVARRWHGERTVLLGDAAHPTLPFLAQGANMALEDAWVLADCLASLPVAKALAKYQMQRRGRVAKVIAAANANARNYHLRNPAARLAAHSVLRFAGAVAPGQVIGRFDWIYAFDVTAR